MHRKVSLPGSGGKQGGRAYQLAAERRPGEEAWKARGEEPDLLLRRVTLAVTLRAYGPPPREQAPCRGGGRARGAAGSPQGQNRCGIRSQSEASGHGPRR